MEILDGFLGGKWKSLTDSLKVLGGKMHLSLKVLGGIAKVLGGYPFRFD